MPSFLPAPLPTLLSQALVAFTIEVDNEFERRVPHRTTDHGAPPDNPAAPWLVSLVMWQMVLRHVPAAGISTRDLRTATGLGLKEFRIWIMRLSTWWDYVTVDANNIVRPTAGGTIALAAWPALINDIETRWTTRFGPGAIRKLRTALLALDQRLSPFVPGYMPILGYGLFTRMPEAAAAKSSTDLEQQLPTVLARVLVAFALDFEAASGMSLAVSANLLRVIDFGDVPVRELPKLTGVSKEAVAMALALLQKSRQIARTLDASQRKILNFTHRGTRAHARYWQVLGDVEAKWVKEFGRTRITALRNALIPIVGNGRDSAPIFEGLAAPAGSWRAKLPAIYTLPEFPTVLHRGGFPDGS